ncbi:MAG TPA: hypothetical protein VFH29_02885 [Anaerolineales bacterium]|nr:hypothetical protein [Anaerolineales bacterium]
MSKGSALRAILLTIGLAIIGAALFAQELGLDPSPGWGRGRLGLLILGVCVVLAAELYRRYEAATLRWSSKRWSRLRDLPVIQGIRQNGALLHLAGLLRLYWFLIPILILILLIYVWFVSAGTWTTWISPTHLYADQARGFLRGNLYIAMKVPEHLLTGIDPFSLGKAHLGYLDVSFFKGRYYLYWGPVPALLLLLLHPIVAWRLGDLQVLMGLLASLLIVECLLLVVIWDRFFKQLPKSMLVLALLLVGLSNPATYMLDYTRGARIYEASITGGQFFLMGGFLAAVTALGPPLRPLRLAAAGILWALAAGTRATLVVPVGFMALMAAWWVLGADQRWSKKLTQLIPLVVALGLGFACLGWYNWARFGSVTETGMYYQLNGTANWHEIYNQLFGPVFIPQNLYNYLLYPFSFGAEFPYIHAEYSRAAPVFSSYALPSFYFAGKITGLVWTLPFAVFAAIPLVGALKRLRNRRLAENAPGTADARALNWIALTLCGTFLVAFGVLLSFFWATMRYLEDVVPALAILAVIGFWQGYVGIVRRPGQRRLYASAGVALAVLSIVVSTLIALSVNDARLPLAAMLTAAK